MIGLVLRLSFLEEFDFSLVLVNHLCQLSMAIILDQVMMLLPKKKRTNCLLQNKKNVNNYLLTLHRSNFAIELFVKITFA